MINNLVTVVMPAFNSEKTIQSSIDCILHQEYPNIELLIIDDGSEDNTIQIIKENITKDNRVKFLKNPKKGVSSARNHGIEHANGEYICFLDSDDQYSLNKIKNQVEFMKINHVKAVTCEIVMTNEELQDIGWSLKGKEKFTFKDFYGCPVHTNSVMFHRSIVENLRFDENFTNGEDWLFWQRIARIGYDFYNVKDCKVFYRQHHGVVRQNFLKHENHLLKVLDIVYSEDKDCRNPLEQYKYGLSSPDKNLVIARRRLQLLCYLIYEKKIEDIEVIKKEINHNKKLLGMNDIFNAVKIATLRYFLCNISEYKEKVKENSYFIEDLKDILSQKEYRQLLEKFAMQEKKRIEVKGSKIKTFLKNMIFKLRRYVAGNKINVIYVPGFVNQEDFIDNYLRIIWYLNPIVKYIDNIYVPYKNRPEDIIIPSYFDSNILDFEKNLLTKVVFFDPDDKALYKKYIEKAHISMQWKLDIVDKELETIYNSRKKLLKNWKVDRYKVQFESSFYLKMSLEANPNQSVDLNKSFNKFKHFTKYLKAKKYDKAFIFGTGPSLDEIFDIHFDFNNTLTIACNSMVKNDSLLNLINPDIFVASDPIFHAGCSSYAEEFRKYLFKALDRFSNSVLIVPFRDYILYESNLPSRFRNRIIGIPFEHLEKFNFDIVNNFKIKSTGNVMTNLLLQLACTFQNKIYMMGYDGRSLANDEYFWSHNKNVQFTDKMDDIQVAHPSFFKLDYNDYYLEHCHTVEQVLQEGEKMKKIFYNLGKSFVPALHNRFFDLEKKVFYRSRRYKKEIVAVLSNCQGGPIKGLIKKHLPNIEFLNIPYVHLLTQEQYQEIYKKLEYVDYIITQPLTNRFGNLSEENLKSKFQKKLIVFPVIFFKGYNPEMFYLKNNNGVSIKNFGIDYHDIFILFGYLNNKTQGEVLSWFMDKNFMTQQQVINYWNNSLNSLKEKEKLCDIHISDIIEKNQNTKLFNTINHPKNFIMDEISHRILEKLSYEDYFDGAKSLLFAEVQLPSYASVKNHLNFEDTNIAIVHSKEKTKNEMIKEYYDFYNSIDREILEFNINSVEPEIQEILNALI